MTIRGVKIYIIGVLQINDLFFHAKRH